MQTLHQVYKSPSNEKTILQLVSEALVDENKSYLKDESLQNILRLIEDCFVWAEDEKHPQKKAIRLENEFCEKRSCSFYHYYIKQSWEKLIFSDKRTETDIYIYIYIYIYGIFRTITATGSSVLLVFVR